MIRFLLFFSLLLLLLNCKDKTRDDLSTRILTFNAAACDTCTSTIIVSHMECTECKDLHVDSGVVYVPFKVVNDFKVSKKQRKETGAHFVKLNTTDLYLEDKNDFYKLWPDTITWGDFYKKYRVTGKVVKLKENSLYFEMLSYTRIDSAYNKSKMK